MGFYQSIADQYENIFPLNQHQADFVRNSFNEHGKRTLLDTGCGTGLLADELSKTFGNVVGIDLNESMIVIAEEKESKAIFKVADMLQMKEVFGNQTFDGILCFGNTLVHLPGIQYIQDFFNQVKNQLKSNGKFLFQAINYNRIIDQNITGLPTIENERIRFERIYNYNKEEHRIDFRTILTVKDSGQKTNNSIQLYPLRKEEIERLLIKAGFSAVQYFGSFKRDGFSGKSIPIVVEAK